MQPSTQEAYSQWLKDNLVGCEVIYLSDNSVGTILSADEVRNAYLIIFEDGLESEQPFHAFKLTEGSLTLLHEKFIAFTEANMLAEEMKLAAEDEQRLVRIKQQMEFALKSELNTEKELTGQKLINEAHKHLSNRASAPGTPNSQMIYPFFQLKSPISTFQLEIEEYIRTTVRKNYSGISIEILFGVPVSQIFLRSEHLEHNAKMFGKVAILVVDKIDYSPICAILVSNYYEQEIMSSICNTLDKVDFPWEVVNITNMQDRVGRLLDDAINQSIKSKTKKPVQYTEHLFGRYLKKKFHAFNQYYRLMEQVGLSEIVDILNYENRNLEKPKNWNNPASMEEFNKLSEKEQYFKLNDFASRSSFDFVIVSTLERENRDDWWPLLAIELDGDAHKIDKAQQFRDELKNRICSESLLPVLRIHLYDSKDRVDGFLKRILDDSAAPNDKYVIDLIFHLITKGLEAGSYQKQSENRKSRANDINIWKRVNVLMENQALSLEQALDVYYEESKETRELDNVKKGTELHTDKMIEDYENRSLYSKYKAIYGTLPEFMIDYSADKMLTASLGQYSLPKVKCFCSFVSGQDLEKYLHAFAKESLLDIALHSQLKGIEQD